MQVWAEEEELKKCRRVQEVELERIRGTARDKGTTNEQQMYSVGPTQTENT